MAVSSCENIRVLAFVFLLLIIFGNIASHECVQLSSVSVARIRQAIASFEDCEHDIGTLLLKEWPTSQRSHGQLSASECLPSVDAYTSPAILLWDVLHSYSVRMLCPVCLSAGTSNNLKRSGKWTDTTWSSALYEPRMIYDLSNVVILVSHIYMCCSNHQVPSHHASIISALPPSVHVPFFLTNRAGFTVDMLTQISSMIDNGLSFHCIESIIRDQYEQSYWRVRLL